MKIAIVGLGIIGGSYAKAIKEYTNHYVIGIDTNAEVLDNALNIGAIDEIGTGRDLAKVDMIILCIYPHLAVEFVEQNGKYIKPDTIVTDTSGIKRHICTQMLQLSKKYNFTFIGSHPMAGKEKSGFAVSEASLFKRASLIVVPCDAPKGKIEVLTTLANDIGFGGVKFCNAEQHDTMVAFTSQLPHILACSYVLSPQCPNHKGFSAGSYRDVSRVANINAELWSELFLQNKEPLLSEINILIDNINKLKTSIQNEDTQTLYDLLDTSRRVKEESDR